MKEHSFNLMYQVGVDRGGWVQPGFVIPDRIGKFFARVETTELGSFTYRFQDVPIDKDYDKQSFVENFGLSEVQE